MTDVYLVLSASGIALVCAVTFMAGLVKGMVGFGMPMIIISGLSSFMAPELALAALIFPTVVSNVWQALRQGVWAAWASVKSFRVFLAVGGLFLLGSAQLVRVLPQNVLYLLIGVPISLFATLQLMGWQAVLSTRSARVEASVGALAGFIGGMSGVWGPPTVAYLTAVQTPKEEQVRVQGTIYGLGAILLLLAHVQSGVLNGATWQLSALLILPAVAGMAIGFRVQDRIDQRLFRRATLCVLLIVGLNLIRRGVFG